MLIQENQVNRTENHQMGDSGLYEPFTDNPGELFRHLRKSFGRCTGSVYIDKDNDVIRVGWVFEKVGYYEDTGQAYLCETWITLFDEPDTVVRTNHHHAL